MTKRKHPKQPERPERATPPKQVDEPRAKSGRRGKVTADKWNQ